MPVSAARPSPPPHGLALVIDFVNTVDPDEQAVALADAAGLQAWLAERELLDPRAHRASEGDRRQAIDLREALRDLMLEHNGVVAGRHPYPVLERVARRGKLSVHFGEAGDPVLKADESGLAGALAALLVPIFESARDGTWARAKACRAGDCRWAFYDRSRNRSGVWCDMAVCGNRAKVRAHRLRGSAAD